MTTTVRELVLADVAFGDLASKLPKRPGVVEAVVGKVSELLGYQLNDVLVQAWRTRSALLEAARETVAQPGLRRRVTIHTYALPWEHSMEFDVRVSGKHLVTVTAALLLELEVTTLVAIVEHGMLTRLEGGSYTASASLTIQGVPVSSRSRQFDLRYEMPIVTGIPLIEVATAH